ncbi:hypothetical protein [Terriglobus albidus]|uniref:hypothetical protein n=1 Tax=Terriglobus albidus TaxID=1592106 RepID=UPI0021E063DA|nr:hypothetical protein [Terriglobus albidus]
MHSTTITGRLRPAKKYSLMLLFAVIGIGIGTARAQYTTVTASSLRTGNAPISVGTVSFQPRDAKQFKQAISLAGGGLLSPDPIVCHVSNGVIDGAVQPDGTVSGPAKLPIKR